MKLKEIKPGMVINCRTEEEVWALINHSSLPRHFANYWGDYEADTCFRRVGSYDNTWSTADLDWYKRHGIPVTPFSDLVIPEEEEEELTVVEAFNIANQMCINSDDCSACNLFNRCFGDIGFDAQKAIDICKQWLKEHKKLQPFSDAGYADPTCEKAVSLCEKHGIEQSVMIDIMKEFLG